MKFLVPPDDGIGPEITDATLAALSALNERFGLGFALFPIQPAHAPVLSSPHHPHPTEGPRHAADRTYQLLAHRGACAS